MKVLLAGIVAAVAMGVSGLAYAGTMAPVKAYVKPNEDVNVQFLDEKPEGKKAIEKIGLAATEIDGMFTPSAVGDVVAADGTPAFKVYNMDGRELEATRKPAAAAGAVNVAAYYPQIREGGTYILTWKGATPLVIETLYNPGRSKADLEKHRLELENIPEGRRAGMMKDFEPTVTHIEMLSYAEIKTDKGLILAKFSYDAAPHTVDNFISLARQKYYDGSAFHRIISGFMIQGGDSLATVEGRAGTGGPGYGIMAEFGSKTHERGTLSMARSNDPNSAGSQFFIMHAQTPFLNGKYAAFGDVVEGLNVVDEIAKTPVSDSNGTVSGKKPAIESVRILPAPAEMYGIKK